jgi:predicted nucleotidyltransferase
MISRKTITDIARKIAESLNPEKILLFGSHAWGKPDKDRDLDLFVIMESTERPIKRAASIRRRTVTFQWIFSFARRKNSGTG